MDGDDHIDVSVKVNGQHVGTFPATVSGRELLQNRGDDQLLDLVSARLAHMLREIVHELRTQNRAPLP